MLQLLYGEEKIMLPAEDRPVEGETVEVPGWPQGDQRTLLVKTVHHLLGHSAHVIQIECVDGVSVEEVK